MKTTQEADVKEPSETDKILDKFFSEKEAAEKKGNTEISNPPAAEPAKAEEAIPVKPNAESAEESVDTLKAELATAREQVAELSTALTAMQTAIADENSETWKHKFEVLDGIAKTQGQRQSTRIKDLEADNKRLKDELEAAKTAAPVQATDPAAVKVTEYDKATADEMGVAPELLARYRQDIVKSVMEALPKPKEAAKPEPAPEIKEPEPEPAKVAAAPEVKLAPEQVAYLTLLNVQAPGWGEASKNPIFAEFIEKNHEMIGDQPGRTLREILIDAHTRRNAYTVASVYNAFLKSVKPAAASEKPSRESADSRSKGGDGAPVAREIWTPEKIRKFNEDVSLGTIKKGSLEYTKLMASYEAWKNNLTVAG